MVDTCWVSAEGWLVDVFEPALRDERIRSSTVVAELSGGLRALEACGLLEPEMVADAQRRMRAAHQQALRRPYPHVVRPGSVAAQPANLLRHAFAPLTPLVDFNGVTLVLASVELWTRSVRLRIAGLNNATSDRLDDEHRTALNDWATKVREAHARGSVPDDPPQEPGARLLDMGLTLTDDVGTEYRWTGGAAGGSATEWRLEAAFEPGIPADAGKLILAAIGTNERLVHEIELEQPSP
ncbi:MAG: hypothetical protein M3N47_08365 [Chloroflexota bacterium]|nr:hypothetical protein [Chloroflexota bacterium]